MFNPTRQQIIYSIIYDEESRGFMLSKGKLQAEGESWVEVVKVNEGKRVERGDFVVGKVSHYANINTPTVIQTFYGRNKLPPFIQTIISLMTPGSTVTATTTLQFINRGNLTQLPSQLQSQGKITVTVKLYEVAKMPDKVNSLRLALDVIEEIIVEGKQGDCFMQHARYEKALKSYQNAVKKVLSQQFSQSTTLLDDQKHPHNPKQQPQHRTLSPTQLQTLLHKCKIICYKYLELCLVQGEQLKVVKVGQRMLKQFGEGWRVYNVMVYAYCRLGELQLAKTSYLRLVGQKDGNQQIVGRLERFMQQCQINFTNLKPQETKTQLLPTPPPSKNPN